MSCGLADAVRYYPIIGGVDNEEGAEQSTWFHFLLRIMFIIHYVCIQVECRSSTLCMLDMLDTYKRLAKLIMNKLRICVNMLKQIDVN